MKKIKSLLAILLITLSMFCLSSCDFNLFPTRAESANKITSIKLIGDNEVVANEFKYSNYTIEITYKDGTTSTTPMIADNLSDEDKEKLKQYGTHTITVIYDDFTYEFEITVTKNADSTIVITEDGLKLEYDKDKDTYSVLTYTGSSVNLTIPQKYNEKLVTKIVPSAF